ncbi:MAG: Na/Pi cotransporter family protein [Spirochaetales bacterium]|nr:Na/Pi cotransporter family protein [Spirochaetales bacterium]
MNLFDVLNLIGGLCLFLFGMNVMGQALERRAGNKLHSVLEKLTTGKIAGFLTGLGITAVIQSSSATTVMVVGFVNSGLMTLKQAINVIIGANIGTTVTAWILSLGGIDSGNFFVQMLKPTSFTPILALVGIILTMACKSSKNKDTGVIFLGFTILMFGMDTMSASVSGLKNVPQFQQMFLMFENPILGMLAGAVLTAIIQSSSASVGILQALSVTGQVSLGAAIPIIMGQNIGTCITAILSSFGTNKNAKRAALVHLAFNVIGTVVWLTVFMIVKQIFNPQLFGESANLFNIAVSHTIFNTLNTFLLLPMSGLLEKLAITLVPDTDKPDVTSKLDERFLATPHVALDVSCGVTIDMAKTAVKVLRDGVKYFQSNTNDSFVMSQIIEEEDTTDHYEDILGTYLVKLSSHQIGDNESTQVTKLLHIINDYERIADHGVNMVYAADQLQKQNLEISESALKELDVLVAAINEILDLSLETFVNNDIEKAKLVEPLEQVIDKLKEKMRAKHILRLQQGECSIKSGFIWADLLTDLERVADHCSNIAICVIDAADNKMNMHESIKELRTDNAEFEKNYNLYKAKYKLPTN